MATLTAILANFIFRDVTEDQKARFLSLLNQLTDEEQQMLAEYTSIEMMISADLEDLKTKAHWQEVYDALPEAAPMPPGKADFPIGIRVE